MSTSPFYGRGPLTLLQDGKSCVVLQRWRRRHHPFILGLSLSGLVFALLPQLEFARLWTGVVWPALLFLSAVGAFYGAIGMFNATRFEFTPAHLTIRSGPIRVPGYGPRRLSLPDGFRVSYEPTTGSLMSWSVNSHAWTLDAHFNNGPVAVMTLHTSRRSAEDLHSLFEDALRRTRSESNPNES